VSSPPTSYSCFYGIATPSRDQLLAARFDVDQMAEFIGVDSLAFLSIDGLYRAMGEAGRDPLAPRFCDACFTGDYPIRPADADAGKVSVQLSLLAAPA
jgi:amidophosphoribosyltransferase